MGGAGHPLAESPHKSSYHSANVVTVFIAWRAGGAPVGSGSWLLSSSCYKMHVWDLAEQVSACGGVYGRPSAPPGVVIAEADVESPGILQRSIMFLCADHLAPPSQNFYIRYWSELNYLNPIDFALNGKAAYLPDRNQSGLLLFITRLEKN